MPSTKKKPAAKPAAKKKVSAPTPKRSHSRVKTDAERRVSKRHGEEWVLLPHAEDPVPLTPERRDTLAEGRDR
jgi:hypothetical protein